MVLFWATEGNARFVQILHTNDTHSFVDRATHELDIGGSAKLKSLIDFYKADGEARGIKTLVMDAGDFLEGNLYYMAERGMKSFQIQNSIGYDAVVLGNHDYLMGARDLNEMLGEIDLNFSLLGANISVSKKFQNIQDKIFPYKEIEIDGIKIAIMGLTTDELYYSWRLEDSRVLDPYRTAEILEEKLKKRKNDFIIALTHLGVSKDKKLAKKSTEIDLIIGGHSHTALFEPVYILNKNKKDVPIVQAGKHIEYLGRIILDLEKNKPLKIISYELVPVKYQAEDREIKNLIKEADFDLDKTYGEGWLDEKIGESDLKPKDPSGSRKWAYFISDALKEKSQADVAIHAPSMNGENFPVGTITRRSILNSFPRVFDLNDTEGWSIYTAKIKGIWLKLAFEGLALVGQPLAFSGIEMKYIKTPFGLKIGRAKINGRPINLLKDYTVAFTEGVIKGAVEISSKTKFLLRTPKKTPFKIWQTLEEKVSQKKVHLTSKISEDNKTFYLPEEE